jgi:hypothetical protein
MNSLSNMPGVGFLNTAGEWFVLVLVVCAVGALMGALVVAVAPVGLRWREDFDAAKWRSWWGGLLLFAAICSVVGALVKVSLAS